MTKNWDPPFFSPKLIFTRMILNITFKSVKFFIYDPPPTVKKFTDFFFEDFPKNTKKYI